MSKDIKIGWAEHHIDDVMKYFTGGMRVKEGVVVNSEWVYDSRSGRVVFKLFVDESKIISVKE